MWLFLISPLGVDSEAESQTSMGPGGSSETNCLEKLGFRGQKSTAFQSRNPGLQGKHFMGWGGSFSAGCSAGVSAELLPSVPGDVVLGKKEKKKKAEKLSGVQRKAQKWPEGQGKCLPVDDLKSFASLSYQQEEWEWLDYSTQAPSLGENTRHGKMSLIHQQKAGQEAKAGSRKPDLFKLKIRHFFSFIFPFMND